MKKTIVTTRHAKFISYAGAALAGLVLANAASANSTRQIWAGNGHYYQRFDGLETWGNAKSHCESLSAHLATITTRDEQNFIQDKFLANQPYQSKFFIGGSDAAVRFGWKWVTGEAWSYTNWYPNHPNINDKGADYLIIRGNAYKPYTWYDVHGYDAYQGHICEWSTNNFVGTTVVSSLNSNGIDEIAALWVDYKTGKHTVQIRDPASKALISTLTFATSFSPPKGLVALEDLNGNGVPEIGVLFSDAAGPFVQIKDAKNNNTVLKTIRFLNTYVPKAVNVVPDTNGNGSSEILVLGTLNGKGAAQIRDSKTGTLLDTAGF